MFENANSSNNKLRYQKHENNFKRNELFYFHYKKIISSRSRKNSRIEILRRENKLRSICSAYARKIFAKNQIFLKRANFLIKIREKIKSFKMLKIFLFLDILEIVKKKSIALRNQTQLNPLRTNPSMDHHLRDVPLSNPLLFLSLSLSDPRTLCSRVWPIKKKQKHRTGSRWKSAFASIERRFFDGIDFVNKPAITYLRLPGEKHLSHRV